MIDSLRKLYSLFSPKDKGRLLILMGLILGASLWEIIGVGVVPTAIAKLENGCAITDRTTVSI